MKPKYTINQPVIFQGIGLHSGLDVRVSIAAADEGTGIRFRRADISSENFIPADANHVTQTLRGTTITQGDISVSTVEHLMAAIHSLHIDDIVIDVFGQEIPILDGSAGVFYDSLKLNRSNIQSTKEAFVVTEPFEFVDEISGSSYTVKILFNLILKTKALVITV